MKVKENIDLEERSFEELMMLFLNDVDDDEYYYVISHCLVKKYLKQIKYILPLFSKIRLRWLIKSISDLNIEEVNELVPQFLKNNDPLVIAESIDALSLSKKINWPDIEPFLNHQSPYVRGAALRFAKVKLGRDAKPLLIEALKDSNPIVRQNGIDEIESMLDHSEINLITPLLQDEDEYVREATKFLLENFKN